MGLTAAVAAMAVATVASTGASIAASSAQSKAIKKASNKQAAIEQQQLDFQKEIYAEGAPSREAFRRMLGTLESGSNIGLSADSQLREEMNILNADLAATGNLRSGVAQDLTLEAVERAADRRFARQSNVASLASGQGNASTAGALSLAGPIAQTGTNISNLMLGQGASKAGLYNSIGQGVSNLAQMYAMSQFLGGGAGAAA